MKDMIECKECGKPVEVEDLSALFEGEQCVTCDECYEKIQEAGRIASEKVRAEWKECGED